MLMPISSREVRTAIEQLKLELPELLGINYSEFMLKLDSLLLEGKDYQLLDLIDSHPAVHQRLLGVIAQLGLFGHPGLNRYTFYRCEKGPHCVKDIEVVQRDDEMNALCPRHNIIMFPVKSCP